MAEPLIIQKYYPNKQDSSGRSNFKNGEFLHACQINHIENGIMDLGIVNTLPVEGSERLITSGGVYTAIQLIDTHVEEQIAERVPLALGSLPIVPTTADKSKLYLYVDNDGSPSRMSVGEITQASLVRTVNEGEPLPPDMAPGEYLYVEI